MKENNISSEIKIPSAKKERFEFIDRFRGVVGVLMLLGHSSYYFNSVWKYLDPLDPLFADWGQFFVRYIGYLCAPGFLMMNGAMVWWAFTKRVTKGISPAEARWHLIQRGLFLVLVQITWVNSSWGGFTHLRPDHLGIIAAIGFSMILLTFIVHWKWHYRIAAAAAILLLHPFLIQISYDTSDTLSTVLMQTFIDSGSFNKYPVLPWFSLAILGSVMATGWLKEWKTDRERIKYGLLIGPGSMLAALFIRLAGGYGNISPWSGFWSWSFFLDQKYPPSLFHNLWFFGAVVTGVTVIIILGKYLPKFVNWLGIVGRVPLFFYAVHIAFLGIFSKRIDIYYREGEVTETLIGFVIMIIIMLPLAAWFGKVKRKSKNYFIRLI